MANKNDKSKVTEKKATDVPDKTSTLAPKERDRQEITNSDVGDASALVNEEPKAEPTKTTKPVGDTSGDKLGYTPTTPGKEIADRLQVLETSADDSATIQQRIHGEGGIIDQLARLEPGDEHDHLRNRTNSILINRV